jgi:SAM-dependent methyltransferase
MVGAGYQVTGLDLSADMLAVAGAHLANRRIEAQLIQTAFAGIPADVGPFDGVFCLGNSLAATGTRVEAERSVSSLGSVLAPGGRLFVQTLNFEKLRTDQSRARGPRARTENGTEYISTRVFSFCGDAVEVISITHWRDSSDPAGASAATGGWRHHTTSGLLYAISAEQMKLWCESAGLKIDAMYGSYAREPFDIKSSGDLIVLATKSA